MADVSVLICMWLRAAVGASESLWQRVPVQGDEECSVTLVTRAAGRAAAECCAQRCAVPVPRRVHFLTCVDPCCAVLVATPSGCAAWRHAVLRALGWCQPGVGCTVAAFLVVMLWLYDSLRRGAPSGFWSEVRVLS